MPTVMMPFAYVADPTADRSLFQGQAYFGRENQDPLIAGNRVVVRKVEEDGTFTDLSQPIVLGAGGVVEVDGAPAQLDIAEASYSILILDRNNTQRYFFPSAGAGGVTGRELLILQGGLPFDDVITTTGPAFLIVENDHTNSLILVDASAAAVTVNLPSAALTSSKFRFTVKKIDSSENTVTIDADGADTVDGVATFVLTEENEANELVCDGVSAWFVSASFIPDLVTMIEENATRSQKNERQVRNVFQRVELILTSNSAYNPSRNGRAKRIICQGAGGNGRLDSGGGGAGGQAIDLNVELVTTDSLNITIAAGGTTDDTTVVGTTTAGVDINLVGPAGVTPTTSAGGAGGTGTGGDINLTGGAGGGVHGGGGGIAGFSPFTTPPFAANGFNGGSRTGGEGAGGGAGVAGDGAGSGLAVGAWCGGGGGTAPWAAADHTFSGGPSAPYENLVNIMPALTGSGGSGQQSTSAAVASGTGGTGGAGGGGGGGSAGGGGGFGGGGGGGHSSSGGPGGRGAGGGVAGSVGGVQTVGTGGDGFVMIVWDESE